MHFNRSAKPIKKSQGKTWRVPCGLPHKASHNAVMRLFDGLPGGFIPKRPAWGVAALALGMTKGGGLRLPRKPFWDERTSC